MTDMDPRVDRLDAQFREADARLDLLRSQAEQRRASDEMDEISGLRAARDRTQRKITELKQRAADEREADRREAERAVHDLEVGIERARERYAAWDAARDRRFNARMDEADAKLKLWDAKADRDRANLEVESHDALQTLKERIALAKARYSAWRAAQHDQKAQEALAESARQFDDAYDAASKRYER